jgi:hypothetical protein
MADSNVTTDSLSGDRGGRFGTRSSPLHTHERRLTVIRKPDGTSDLVPLLRINGRWLEAAGFTVGRKVSVVVSQNRLVIDLVGIPPERAPRLPRTFDASDCVYY